MNGHLVTLARRARGENAAFAPLHPAFYPIGPGFAEVDDVTTDTIGHRRRIRGRARSTESDRRRGEVDAERSARESDARQTGPTGPPRRTAPSPGIAIAAAREGSASARPLTSQLAPVQPWASNTESPAISGGIPGPGVPSAEGANRGIAAVGAAPADEAIDGDGPASPPPKEDDETRPSTSSHLAVKTGTFPALISRDGRRIRVLGERRIPVRVTAGLPEPPNVNSRSRDGANDLDSASPAPGGEEPVRITIGRIEVRGGAPPAPCAPPKPGPPRLSLEEYLRQRNRTSEK